MRTWRDRIEHAKQHVIPIGRLLAVFALAIAVALVIWYFSFPVSEWANTSNYLALYLSYIVSYPLQAFFTVNTGASGEVVWLAVIGYAAIIAHIILYWEGRKRGNQYTIINKYFLALIILLGLFAISFQNAAMYYGWYWDPVANQPGYVDTWTHITSALFIATLILPFALERYLGWKRRYFWVPVLMIMIAIAIGWEIGENVLLLFVYQGVFFNFPMDSIHDIIFSAIVAPILAIWAYQQLVMDPGE